MKSNTTPPRRPSTAPSLSLITSSSSPRTSTSNRSSISSTSSKSPGSSPRTPLLLSTIEPSTLSLSDDDPSLDMDFELLFLHDDAVNNSTTSRIKAPTARGKSIFTEEQQQQQQQHITPSSRHMSSNLPSPNEPPTVTRRRDWSTFNFSHYGPPALNNLNINIDSTSDAAHENGYGYGYAGAVGVRGKGRTAEMYTRNRAEMPRRRR